MRAIVGLLILMGMVFVICWRQRDHKNESPPAYIQAILPDATCPAPCWQGIQPGKSNLMEIHSAINQLPGVAEIDKNWWAFYPDSAHRIHVGLNEHDLFIQPAELALGDMLLIMGAPDYITIQADVEARTVKNHRTLQLYYEDAQVTLFVPLHDRLRVTSPVVNIRYGTFSRPFHAVSWPGLVYAQAIPFLTGKN